MRRLPRASEPLAEIAQRETRVAITAFVPPFAIAALLTPVLFAAAQMAAFAVRTDRYDLFDIAFLGISSLFIGLGLSFWIAPLVGLAAVLFRFAGRRALVALGAVAINLLVAWLLLGGWVTGSAAALSTALATAGAPPLLGAPHVSGPIALVFLLLNLPILFVAAAGSLLTGGVMWKLIVLVFALAMFAAIGLTPSVVYGLSTVTTAVVRGVTSRHRDTAEPKEASVEDHAIHVKITAWYNLVVGAFGVFAAVVVTVLVIIFGAAFIAPLTEAEGLLPVGLLAGGFGLAAIVSVGVMAVLELLAGIGILRRAEWGRILGFIVALLRLPILPIGTAIGLYNLWALGAAGSRQFFERKSG